MRKVSRFMKIFYLATLFIILVIRMVWLMEAVMERSKKAKKELKTVVNPRPRAVWVDHIPIDEALKYPNLNYQEVAQSLYERTLMTLARLDK